MAVGPEERVLAVPPGGGVLVFDGRCGFCTRAVYAVRRRDRRGRVRVLPLQGPGVLELAGLTREQALREAWWIGADGARLHGAEAMTAAVASATGLPLLRLVRLPGVGALAARAYRTVAAHRRSLRGGEPYCAAVGPVRGMTAPRGAKIATRRSAVIATTMCARNRNP